MVANLALTIGLMPFLAHVGVALALTLSGWLQALTLLVLLVRHGHFRLDQGAARIPRIAAAALGMAGISSASGFCSTRRSPAPRRSGSSR